MSDTWLAFSAALVGSAAGGVATFVAAWMLGRREERRRHRIALLEMLDSLIGTPAGLSTAVLAASRREATYLTAAEMALGARLADRASVQTLAEEVERRLLPRGRRGVVHPA